MFKFPATGLRDMGTPSRTWDKGTWPAHSKLTFIATSGFHYNKNEEKPSSSCLLFSIDDRSAEIEADVNINGVTQNYDLNGKTDLSVPSMAQTTLTALHCVLSMICNIISVHGKA